MAGWTHTGYAQEIRFGVGVLGQVGEVVRALGLRRVMLVTTPGRAGSPDGERLAKSLGRSLASTCTDARPHVPTSAVQAAVQQARRDGIDGLVSFGGGSCADLGKAVAFFTEQEAGTPGAGYADRPALPHVAIPTTYSGAELTPFFGMTDEHTRRKTGAGGPTVAPLATLHDPAVTVTTPPRVSAETGMGALAHCVEAAWSDRRTPEAAAIALAGCRAIVEALPRVVEAPDDLEARTAMLEGAVLGGRCLHNGPTGIHHALAELVGGRTGLAHGLVSALLLPHAVRFMAGRAPEAVGRVGEAVGAADDPSGAVAELQARLGLPGTLSDCGFDDEDLEAVLRQSQEPAAREILEAAF